MSNQVLTLSEQALAPVCAGFSATFGANPTHFFSAPGRTEIGGNHTDHQRGRVLAAAVNLHTLAAVRENGTNVVRIQSEGYPLCQVDLSQLTPVESEVNSTPALVRGIAARFTEMGCTVRGFDAYVTSTVLPGSGLSSSAAFEVLIGTILNHMFFGGKVSQPEIAMIGQYAENVFFGKPCGLMDQMASAVGSMVTIDFFDKENPIIEPIAFDFEACGHALCIIDTHASHADLTDEYAAITLELKAICQHFGKDVLTQIDKADLLAAIPTTDIGDNKKALQILEGDIPSPVNPPKGCKFHTRCDYCKEICKSIPPMYKEVEDGHFCACHLYNTAEEEAAFEQQAREMVEAENVQNAQQ